MFVASVKYMTLLLGYTNKNLSAQQILLASKCMIYPGKKQPNTDRISWWYFQVAFCVLVIGLGFSLFFSSLC